MRLFRYAANSPKRSPHHAAISIRAAPPFARGSGNGVQLFQRDHRALDRLFTARAADGTRVLCHPPVLRGGLHDGPEESVALGGGWLTRSVGTVDSGEPSADFSCSQVT